MSVSLVQPTGGGVVFHFCGLRLASPTLFRHKETDTGAFSLHARHLKTQLLIQHILIDLIFPVISTKHVSDILHKSQNRAKIYRECVEKKQTYDIVNTNNEYRARAVCTRLPPPIILPTGCLARVVHCLIPDILLSLPPWHHR